MSLKIEASRSPWLHTSKTKLERLMDMRWMTGSTGICAWMSFSTSGVAVAV